MNLKGIWGELVWVEWKVTDLEKAEEFVIYPTDSDLKETLDQKLLNLFDLLPPFRKKKKKKLFSSFLESCF